MVRWAARNLDSISISLDGPPDVQDRQRPLVNGRGSSARVERSLRLIDSSGVTYTIRATVTDLSVSRMGEIAAYILTAFPRVQLLVLDPLSPSYLSEATGWRPTGVSDFVNGYLDAQRVVDECGAELSYSGFFSIHELTGYHCDSGGTHVSVVPDGLVTSCPLVTSVDDPRAEFCVYGRYRNGHFEYDWSKLRQS